MSNEKRSAEKAARAAEKAAEKQREAERKAAEKQDRAGKKEEKIRARREKRSHIIKELKIICIVLAVVLVAAAGGAGYLGYRVTNSGRIYPHVTAADIELGGLTAQEADAKLGEMNWEKRCDAELTVKLPRDLTIIYNREETGAEKNREEAIQAALEYGRMRNWYANLLDYTKCVIHGYDITSPVPELNDRLIEERAAMAAAEFKRLTENEGYRLDEETGILTLVKGGGQIALDEEKLCQTIKEALIAGEESVSFETLEAEPKAPSFDEIYAELAKEPVNAYYDYDEKVIVPSQKGVSFSPEEARKLWEAAAPGAEVQIQTELVDPEDTTEKLQSIYFAHCLGAKTTSYSGSTESRVNNINLAVSKINGMILNPGDVFSYNDVIGQRTEENGFEAASAYADGVVVQEIGGGICQVSSTLYCASLYARMTTRERQNHYFAVNYINMGQDATVSWPGPNFRFRNDREYPVKIIAYLDPNYNELTIEIWGTDTDGITVELHSNVYELYDEEYTNVLIGYSVQPYRYYLDEDGTVVDVVYQDYFDIYHLHDEDIKWPPGVTPPVRTEDG